MPVTYKNLSLNHLVNATTSASPDVLDVANNGNSQINAATAINTDTSSRTLYIYILPSNVSASTVAPVSVVEIPADSTQTLDELIGHIIPKSGSIQAYSSVSDVIRVSLSGIEII